MGRLCVQSVCTHSVVMGGWIVRVPREVVVEFPVQSTKTLSGLHQRVLRIFQPDHANGTLRTPSTLSRAVGLVDHCGSE